MSIKDIKDSINSVLFERVTSPFYGTLLISWLLWNWKIPYITLFVSENRISGTRIDYILENCVNGQKLYLLPLISTVILITIIPFFSHYAFVISLKYKSWKIKAKNSEEDNRLLTLKQSLELRLKIREQEKFYGNQIDEKENELQQKKKEIEGLERILIETQNNEKKETNNSSFDKNLQSGLDKIGYDNFARSTVFKYWEGIVADIKSSGIITGVARDALDYFIINEIIAKDDEYGSYHLTQKGDDYYKIFLNSKFNPKTLV